MAAENQLVHEVAKLILTALALTPHTLPCLVSHCLNPVRLTLSVFFRISRTVEAGAPIPCYKSEVAQVRLIDPF